MVARARPECMMRDSPTIFASTQRRRRTLLRAAAAAVTLCGVALAVRRHAPAVTDPAVWREAIAGFGAFAPAAFVAVQAAQVVVAPIPAPVTALLGGYLFGTLAGTLYSVMGATLGSYVAFTLSRRYGRAYVERTFDASLVKRFDGVVERAGAPGLLVLFLLPGFPDDLLCFTAGVARVDRSAFLGLILVGRTPGFLLTSYAGGSIVTHPEFAVAAVAAGVVLSVAGLLAQDTLVGVAASAGDRLGPQFDPRPAVRQRLDDDRSKL